MIGDEVLLLTRRAQAAEAEVERLQAHVRHLLTYCYTSWLGLVYCHECGAKKDGKHAPGCGVGAVEEAVK